MAEIQQIERTTADEVAMDRFNAGFFCEWFSTDRIKVAELVAVELMDLALQLGKRRGKGDTQRLRNKLEVMGAVQWTLARRKVVDMRQVRCDLAGVGLVIPQMVRDDFGRVAH